MKNLFLGFYRYLPLFKGKLRLGKLFFNHLINKKNVVEFTAHYGIEYKIPNTLENLGSELMINGIYEKKLVSFLNAQIKPNDLYIDVGANIGCIGLPVVSRIPSVKYIGIEASPNVFRYLEYNMQKNRIDNYSLHNYLVHECDNLPVKFYEAEQYGKSSLAPTYTEQYIFVKSITIDSFCKEQRIAYINWMKIDVQGFELFVFKGMRQLILDKKVANIIFEFEYWAEEAAGLEKGSAQQYLSDLGYDLFGLNGEKLQDVITTGRAMVWAKPAT